MKSAQMSFNSLQSLQLICIPNYRLRMKIIKTNDGSCLCTSVIYCFLLLFSFELVSIYKFNTYLPLAAASIAAFAL
jgi:hypothetical protein